VVQEIRFEAAFVDVYQRIWETLRAEVDAAYAQATGSAAAS
jgi:NitT/TauT family transport system ATP-binding protein